MVNCVDGEDNDCVETIGIPTCLLELFHRVVIVSREFQKIVKAHPALDFG